MRSFRTLLFEVISYSFTVILLPSRDGDPRRGSTNFFSGGIGLGERGGPITNGYIIFALFYLLFKVYAYNACVQINKRCTIYPFKPINYENSLSKQIRSPRIIRKLAY